MPRERAEGELRRMLRTLCHENFYVAGTWMDERLGVFVGWTARKNSFADGMPLRNERGDVTLVFSGEEFSEPTISQNLREHGREFQMTGPSYLVHAYENRGETFPLNLNGRFHGVVADQRKGTVALFNDRYGMHRLYYHESNEAFYFAVEAKAILAVCPDLRRIDPRAVAELVTCGCTLEGRSLFAGVQQLPAGSRWVFAEAALRSKEKYFQPSEWENEPPLTIEAFYTQLRDVFVRNLPQYFQGTERTAMSLTGGLDTRMIMAHYKAESASLPCYTFGSMMRENHDVRVARRVAEACRQPFQVIVTGEEFLRNFGHYAERTVYLTDGCVEVSRAPDLYINEKAREIAPVRVTGNYGGEILRRVRTFKPFDPPPELFVGDLVPYVQQTRETYQSLLGDNPVSFAAFKQMPWNHYGMMALEETQLAMRSPYMNNEIVRAAIRAPQAALSSDSVCLRLIADGNQSLLNIPTDRGVGGTSSGVGRWLRRTLLEGSFKAEYAYDMGMPQWLATLDHAISAVHPERLFLGRHKVFHFRVWYRGALAGYLQEVLLDPRSLSRPYLQPKTVEQMVRGHLKGNRNYTNEIHKLLTLEIIHRLFIDTAAESAAGTRRMDAVPALAN